MIIKDRIVVITGSGQGLGKAFAHKLLKEGAKVCLSDWNEETGLKSLAQFSGEFGVDRVHFIRCDVTKETELKQLYDGCETFFSGSVDIFCNNAGINHMSGWRKCMDIDIIAVMSGTELAFDRMDVRNGGKGGLVVNTASLAGIVPGFTRESASYFVAKHGVVTLTRALGQPAVLKQSGVMVQCICPSFAETGILSDLDQSSKERIDQKFGIMTPEFVADAFITLIKSGENGAAMAVVKDTPPFIYTDHSKQSILALAIGAKIVNKVFGCEVFTGRHQLLLFLAVMIFIHLCIYMLLI